MSRCECGSMIDFDYINSKENIIICSNCKEKLELNKVQVNEVEEEFVYLAYIILKKIKF